ncbi:hypothetical protein LIER_08587 [Lithospermum erythrorhizon]|uniref:Uncharacterized protein n=1 Tax=Lithospermum erythrorhizon TaxID=34254 RepID=A0AAV3PFF7_LITER
MRENQLDINSVRKGEEVDNSPKEKKNPKRPIPHEEVEEIPFKPVVKDRTFKIGTRLDDTHREKVTSLIREFEDVFAWCPEDMPGVDPEVEMHRLHVDSMFVIIKQRKRNFSDGKNMERRPEVKALLKDQAIHKLQFLNG